MSSRNLLLLVMLFSLKESSHGSNVVRWIESPRLTDWGSWKAQEMCPPDSWITAINLKIEPDQGYTGDDSGLNAIKLSCSNINGLHTSDITSGEGPWGFYRGKKYCKSGFATGFQLRSEPNLHRGDDAAAIDVKMLCSLDDGSTSEVIGGGILTYGDWTEKQVCPPETAICGIRTQIEDQQGSGDDSSLNNVDFACCNLPFDVVMYKRKID